MHPNQAFRKTERQTNIDFSRQRSFGLLSINAEPSPLVSHIPFQLSADGNYLEAHLVRSNPIVRLLNEPKSAVIAISGADGYISPDWYQVDNQVPTWNYVAIHLRGQLRQLDASMLRAILENLSSNMEQRLLPKTPWTIDKLDEAVFATLSKQIVPIAMDITEINATWKLTQNKPVDARLAAASALEDQGVGQELTALAALMRQPPA